MNILLYRGNFNGNRSVPSNFMSDIEYSVLTSDVIKSFDCINSAADYLVKIMDIVYFLYITISKSFDFSCI